MGVLSRFTTYVKSLFSSMLDRAEDPGQTLDYSYQKQLEQLQNLRRSIADVVTSEKRLELQKAQLTAQVNTYDDQARRALSMNQEDLARQEIARSAMDIAASMCIYTNDRILLYTLGGDAPAAESSADAKDASDAAATKEATAAGASRRKHASE